VNLKVNNFKSCAFRFDPKVDYFDNIELIMDIAWLDFKHSQFRSMWVFILIILLNFFIA